MSPLVSGLAGSGIALAVASTAFAQASEFAVRFHGTGQNQQDRIRIPIDDDAPGPDASAPCDVGAGSFTIELWLRGRLEDNGASGNGGGDVETADERWIDGNIFFDRDIWGPSDRDFGASLAGGHVRFGTGAGDSGDDLANTIEGSVQVLDDAWHHVALVRDAATGIKSIWVDGVLDFQSSAGASDADLSYPDDGVPGSVTQWGPYIVLGAEKHDAGPSYPSFDGFMDQVRVWAVARTAAEIAATWNREVLPGDVGLVADWRLERGAGTEVFDLSSAASPAGELIADQPGNGEWVSRLDSASNVAPIQGGSLPAGFALSMVASGLVEPTFLEPLPDGRFLVGERGGVIHVLKNGSLLPTPLLSLAVDTFAGERGLVALILDPQFSSNGWIYVYFTTPEPRNQVSRFTVSGDLADPASELVVWANSGLADLWHHGGAMGFLPDGTLLIATGDQFNSANAQDPASQHGKLLRLNSDGTIPSDNPFLGDPTYDPAIFALGMRNPFRACFDDVTGVAWIGNVGGNGNTSWEEIEIARAGANFGWPYQEGPDCYTSDCSPFDFPAWEYQHDDPRYFEGSPQASISLGPIGRSAAFPAELGGQLWFGDYANRWIRRLVLDAAGNARSDGLFLGWPDAGTIVDLAVGAEGSLWFVVVGVPWSGSADTPAVWRIDWTGGGNAPPVAVASAAPTEGLEPLAVQFTGSGSFDVDAGPSPLTHSWDFGDGNGSTVADPLHTYAARGAFDAVLTVDDGAAATSSAPIRITVGNPPDPTVFGPAHRSTYRAGDRIEFSGRANDVEDGPLPKSAHSWKVVLVHSGHVHPFLGPIDGVFRDHFFIPLHGHPPEDAHFEIQLTATDSDSIESTAAVKILPEVVPLSLRTEPAGIPLFLDGQAHATPAVYRSLARYQHQLEAPAVFELGGVTWAFVRFGDDGPRVRRFLVPDQAPPLGAYEILAEYAPATLQTVEVSVATANANAEYYVLHGEQLKSWYDPDGLYFGRDSIGELQSGVQFVLPIPRGVAITHAEIVFTGTGDSAGSPTIEMRSYATGNSPAFNNDHSHDLTVHETPGAAIVAWSPPFFSRDVEYVSPDVSALVQEVIDRDDWNPGQRFGVVLTDASAGTSDWRGYFNRQSGFPPRIRVTWADPIGGQRR